MPIYHVQMKFTTPDNGWVEQWYRLSASFGEALAAAQSLALARYQILGQGVQLYRVRVTQPGIPHASMSVDLSGATLSQPAMNAYEGAEIALSAGTERRHNRSYFLRGLPVGSLVNPAGPSSWAPFIEGPVTAWLGLLTAGGWYSRCRGYVGPQFPLTGLGLLTAPGSDYDQVDDGPEGPSIYSTAACVTVLGMPTVPPTDTNFGEPPMVRIGRARWSDLWAVKKTPINGEFPAIAAVGQSIQYLATVPDTGEYAGGGYAQVTQQVFLPIMRTLLRRGGVRKCGGPGRDAPAPGAVGTFNSPVITGLTNLLVLSLSPFQSIANLASDITPLEIAPPVINPPVPPPFPVPVSATLNNAQDALLLIYNELTFSGEGSEYKPIGIAQVLNLENTWWVGMAGLYQAEGTGAGLDVAVWTGLGQLGAYARAARAAIDADVPADAKLIFQGFSLGGMTSENVGNMIAIRPRVAQITTFGSPMTGVGWGRAPIKRIKVNPDLVPTFTPLGMASYLAGNLGYTVIDTDQDFPDFWACHQQMPFNGSLSLLDAWGQTPAGRPPLVLGPIQKFRALP